MHMDLVWLAVVSLSLPLVSECTPLYIMSAPNLLRVGTVERVFVEAQDYAGGSLNVKIRVLTYPSKNRELTSTQVTLREGNSFQDLVEIKVPDLENVFERKSLEKQYVYLQAQFPAKQLEKVVLLSFQHGYIFTQTDKTIYTPSGTVYYRVFPLNAGLQPSQSSVLVDFMTPDGITINREDLDSNSGMKSKSFKLPDPSSLGTWKLVSRFKTDPKTNFTVEFEVKEYVLPSFEVTLKPEKAFFYIDDDELMVKIKARYLFGKEVSGMAYVVFGVTTDENRKRSFPGSLQRVQIISGQGEASLKRAHILQSFPKIQELVGKQIHISVSVLTNTGSEMVEAQRSGIHIVTSPYSIHFIRTPKYFKPGMPFDVSVLVTNPDESPAKGVIVEVSPGRVRGRTAENGIAKVTINTEGGANTLAISVKTGDPLLTEPRQARSQMTALAYSPKHGSRNYLHIGVSAAELTIGDQLKINLNLGGSPGVQEQDFTLMVLSKGQIVSVNRIRRMRGQALVSLYLTVTKDMVPAFRLVAYYHVGSSEVVSDSVWVDVKDTCMGTLKVDVSRRQVTYEPHKPFSLKITGDPGAKVGLVAVDKGVYVLNNKNRLTQTKIWNIIEKHDTGCTAGSGKDSMGVFYDAGLLFESNTAGGTESRSEPTCPSPPKRRRRAITIVDFKNSLASKYTGMQRECCIDGMRDNILDYTCDRRSEFIVDGAECVQAFLRCCRETVSQRKENAESEQLLSESEDAAFTNSDDIVSRSEFPESWLWEEAMLPDCPGRDSNCATTSLMKNSVLKDSITTWEITAISVSKTRGICVADTLEMVVVKDFFIDLKLPYSAVRNEQLEIKAILHNYIDDDIQVRVFLLETRNVCSAATQKKKFQVTVRVRALSSRAVPFIIIPTDLGLHPIEVKAVVVGIGKHDGVKKKLLVVSEGVLTTKELKNIQLSPKNTDREEVKRIRAPSLKNQVPGTTSSTHISASAEVISVTVEKAISGESMGSLIRQPGGCGEQNMVGLTLPVIATHYLDRTRQWNQVGANLRNQAVNYINRGYAQQLSYRKADGSYAAYISRPSSTWLTAYVAKVFAMANEIVGIQRNVICSALSWLVQNVQAADGSFTERAPVITSSMTGNVRGRDTDVSMTAFVLIAMQEGRSICAGSIVGLENSMRRATDFVENRLNSVNNPYAVAMASYALANAGRLNTNILLRHAAPGRDHWPVHESLYFTLEATAYALLALTKVRDYQQAAPIVKWLGAQRRYGGGYGTTQSTIMVFQAVAEYRIHAEHVEDVGLDVEIQLSGRARPILWKFTPENVLLTRTEKIDHSEDITVTARGHGEVMLSIVALYYAKPTEDSSVCKNFELKVTFEKERRVTYPGASETYKLTIYTQYLGADRDATMSILDISLLTGFVADESDLKALSTGRERYIQRFEMDKVLSERGSLIIYLDKVSHTLKDKIAFRMHKVMNVGMLQPAGVTVYEYYSIENRCVKFYHPSKETGALSVICEKDVCQCALDKCNLQRKEGLDETKRNLKACERGIEFVYKATLESSETDLSTQMEIYHMKIIEAFKVGVDADVMDQRRSFFSSVICNEALGLKEGKDYLIMGRTTPPDLLLVDGSYQYTLGERTWIEYWPTKEDSRKSAALREAYKGMEVLIQDMLFGCKNDL
ncbi:complement C3-like [Chanos chanos]|uniref:Complement C3-like n=1 Tax=Chanos chanos TaxID=29144 RepID=A0A6J2VTA8_CHACN|nr:complement C3-like [Chanos chanos]